jgi:hypothetical protein
MPGHMAILTLGPSQSLPKFRNGECHLLLVYSIDPKKQKFWVKINTRSYETPPLTQKRSQHTAKSSERP